MNDKDAKLPKVIRSIIGRVTDSDETDHPAHCRVCGIPLPAGSPGDSDDASVSEAARPRPEMKGGARCSTAHTNP